LELMPPSMTALRPRVSEGLRLEWVVRRSSARWLDHRNAVSERRTKIVRRSLDPEPRFKRQSLVCDLKLCAVVAINRGAATRFKRGWSSLGAWWCGATVECLLGGSESRRHRPHHQSVSANKPVDSSPVSGARFAVRIPCLPLPVAPRRRSCFRGNQTAV
jgi:hypothetical protein